MITSNLISNTLNGQIYFDFEDEAPQTIQVDESNTQILYSQDDVIIRAVIYDQGVLSNCYYINIRNQEDRVLQTITYLN